MDMNDFSQIFFTEAEELLTEMEQLLLQLDIEAPDQEQLNAIFRAAHSLKGGAATFGFTALQETTHLLENLLDQARAGERTLSRSIINLFLECKDIMQAQLEAYQSSQEPDEARYRYICEALREIALEGQQPVMPAEPAPASASTMQETETTLVVTLRNVGAREQTTLHDELTNMGEVTDVEATSDSMTVTLQTTASAEDITAVLCFVLDSKQIEIRSAEATPPVPTPAALPQTVIKKAPPAPRAASQESGSIRVAVSKVDQIINQVGELIITQAMLSQLSKTLDPASYDLLSGCVAQMERNTRELQESVMSIRMMPMDYVFSRFPRLVRDLAGKLNKQIELTLMGSSTELDKSLIERIIDPLTHLVRNSLDHGIELPENRIAAGKSPVGNLILSAEHQGGNICIEVTDDGAGLNRERILAKAISQGMAVSENMTDEEVGMLIFAPGFSTAEQVTDVSGRGVGMDVVKRNSQEMGGHVEIQSKQGSGTTIRILLPLTLAILDGMSVKVADEVFILPLNAVMESLQPREEDLHPLAGGERVLEVRGEYLPLVELWKVFEVDGAKTEATQGIVVILQSAGRRYALLVDQLIGQHQVVVKNLESNYRKVPGISAATILGDGSVALIVDVSALQGLNREQRVAYTAA